MKPDLLKRFLVELPSQMRAAHPTEVEYLIYRTLYYAASDEGEHLSLLFPHISDDEIAELNGYSFEIGSYDKKPFYNVKSSGSSYSHPKGKACARRMKKDEPIYRCEQCGYDDTCVLCVHCFNRYDHVDHNVSVSVSNGGSGICDCGDPEAFKPLNCRCQSQSNPSIDLSELESSLSETIKICLDYILDVTNFAIQTLPSVHDMMNDSRVNLSPEIVSEFSSLPSELYGGVQDSNFKDEWFLVLWNDERHNSTEAKNAIKSGIGGSESKLEDLTHEIDSKGRCIIQESKSVSRLIKTKDKVERGGLIATIVSSRDYARDNIVEHLISWLVDIVQFTSNSSFSELSKSILAELLLEPGHQLSKPLPRSLFNRVAHGLDELCFVSGLVLDNEFPNMGLCEVKRPFEAGDLENRANFVLQPKSDLNFISKSRLQYFLLFEIRLTKSTRRKLSSIFLQPIVSDLDNKAIFANQFMEIFPSLFSMLAITDREEDLSSLHEVSVQILTCPTCVSQIYHNNQIGNILGPLSYIIEKYSSEWNDEAGFPNYIEPARFDSSSLAMKKAIMFGVDTAKKVTDKSFAGSSISGMLEKENFFLLLMFLRNFQGYWPLIRKYGTHVELESYDFRVHLEFSLKILEITKSVATYDLALDDEVNAVSLIMDHFELLPKQIDSKGRITFRVSKDPVSFINSINSLLSYILQAKGVTNFSTILSKIPFIYVSDFSLRSIVLGFQIKIGFWIRNGVSASRQSSLYFDPVFADHTYVRDFHLCQVGAIYDNPQETLLNFLHRWELLKWYENSESHDKTIYEDRFNSISEKFIIFLYNLITDRSCFLKTSAEERLFQQARLRISYSLCEEPRSYSDLRRHVGDEINSLEKFDDLLSELAEYQEPTGLTDTGLYRLRASKYEDLDSISLFLDSSKYQEVSETLIKNIAKNKGIPEDGVILTPKISTSGDEFVDKNIGQLVKSKEFAKLIYKYLQVAIDTSDETYLPQLLHLIHAVLKDDELLFGEKYLSEHFVNISITDLLLTIVESTMSKYVVSKADYLVDQLISKDSRIIENLIDSFGEEHIKSYKRKKTVETEVEKKKRLAEERKAKIMKKFAKKRDKFLQQNLESSAIHDSLNEKEEHSSSATLRTCVLCGETEATNGPFGILASVSEAATFWKVPEDRNRVKIGFTRWNEKKNDLSMEKVYGEGFNYSSFQSEFNNKMFRGNVFTTCGHGMHYACYSRPSQELSHFACPLCHNLHNKFIPSFISPSTGGGIDIAELSKAPINNKYNQILASSSSSKSRNIIEGLVHEDYIHSPDTDFTKFARVLVDNLTNIASDRRYLVGINNNEKYFNNLQNISVMIADTIRMNEIATRYEGEEAYSNFLKLIPNPSKILLRSLIQCRAVMYECRSSPLLLNSKYDLSFEVESFWNSGNLLDGVFNEVLSLYFQTDESLLTLGRLGMTKLLTVTLYSLISRHLGDPGFQFSLLEVRSSLEDSTKNSFISLMKLVSDPMGDWEIDYESLAEKFYFATEMLMLPFLRQLVILEDLITSEHISENTFQSLDKFENLDSEILLQERIEDITALTKVLGLPTLPELIDGLISQRFDFESKILEIVLAAKIPKYFDVGILALEYPGVVSLIDMVKDYNACVIDSNNSSPKAGYDKIVCLICGSRVKRSKGSQHLSECAVHTGVFFIPRLNLLRIITHIDHSPINVEISGPYLTVHGEVKKISKPGSASLNKYRYAAFNKLWLNQGLRSFVTRNIFSSRSEGNVMNVFVEEDDRMDEDMEGMDESSDEFDEETLPEDINNFLW
ncbi:ubiquitin-protein ligase E3 component N-recognin-1 (N-end-recognizing protein) [Scheffersomyces coipomensis]|uniref:ubiquitin-protein ligase E3 component N-recognin-1 (N-end-recognizing protein) n=1 Tax=Scheffersomyces coipomensis TaxID=1788519 RepID=UPI00315DAD0A